MLGERWAASAQDDAADVSKVRRTTHLTWEGATIEACLDDVAGVGHYAELDGYGIGDHVMPLIAKLLQFIVVGCCELAL